MDRILYGVSWRIILPLCARARGIFSTAALSPRIRSKGKFRFRRGKWNGRGDYAEITSSDSNLPGHATFDHCLQLSLFLHEPSRRVVSRRTFAASTGDLD